MSKLFDQDAREHKIADAVEKAEELRSQVRPDPRPDCLGPTPENQAFHGFVRENRELLREHSEWEGQVQYEEWNEGVERYLPNWGRTRNNDQGMEL